MNRKGQTVPMFKTLKWKDHGIADQSIQFQPPERTEEICLEGLKNGEGLGGGRNRVVLPT